MKLLNELISKINTLEKENKIFKAKIKSLETKIEKIVPEPEEQKAIISPKRIQTLDALNIWMGIKSGNEYQYMAKLKVYYDEENDEWYSALPPEKLNEIIGNRIKEMMDDDELFEDLIDLQEYFTTAPDKVVTDITITGSTLMVHKAPPYAQYYPG